MADPLDGIPDLFEEDRKKTTPAPAADPLAGVPDLFAEDAAAAAKQQPVVVATFQPVARRIDPLQVYPTRGVGGSGPPRVDGAPTYDQQQSMPGRIAADFQVGAKATAQMPIAPLALAELLGRLGVDKAFGTQTATGVNGWTPLGAYNTLSREQQEIRQAQATYEQPTGARKFVANSMGGLAASVPTMVGMMLGGEPGLGPAAPATAAGGVAIPATELSTQIEAQQALEASRQAALAGTSAMGQQLEGQDHAPTNADIGSAAMQGLGELVSTKLGAGSGFEPIARGEADAGKEGLLHGVVNEGAEGAMSNVIGDTGQTMINEGRTPTTAETLESAGEGAAGEALGGLAFSSAHHADEAMQVIRKMDRSQPAESTLPDEPVPAAPPATPQPGAQAPVDAPEPAPKAEPAAPAPVAQHETVAGLRIGDTLHLRTGKPAQVVGVDPITRILTVRAENTGVSYTLTEDQALAMHRAGSPQATAPVAKPEVVKPVEIGSITEKNPAIKPAPNNGTFTEADTTASVKPVADEFSTLKPGTVVTSKSGNKRTVEQVTKNHVVFGPDAKGSKSVIPKKTVAEMSWEGKPEAAPVPKDEPTEPPKDEPAAPPQDEPVEPATAAQPKTETPKPAEAPKAETPKAAPKLERVLVQPVDANDEATNDEPHVVEGVVNDDGYVYDAKGKRLGVYMDDAGEGNADAQAPAAPAEPATPAAPAPAAEAPAERASSTPDTARPAEPAHAPERVEPKPAAAPESAATDLDHARAAGIANPLAVPVYTGLGQRTMVMVDAKDEGVQPNGHHHVGFVPGKGWTVFGTDAKDKGRNRPTFRRGLKDGKAPRTVSEPSELKIFPTRADAERHSDSVGQGLGRSAPRTKGKGTTLTDEQSAQASEAKQAPESGGSSGFQNRDRTPLAPKGTEDATHDELLDRLETSTNTLKGAESAVTQAEKELDRTPESDEARLNSLRDQYKQAKDSYAAAAAAHQLIVDHINAVAQREQDAARRRQTGAQVQQAAAEVEKAARARSGDGRSLAYRLAEKAREMISKAQTPESLMAARRELRSEIAERLNVLDILRKTTTEPTEQAMLDEEYESLVRAFHEINAPLINVEQDRQSTDKTLLADYRAWLVEQRKAKGQKWRPWHNVENDGPTQSVDQHVTRAIAETLTPEEADRLVAVAEKHDPGLLRKALGALISKVTGVRVLFAPKSEMSKSSGFHWSAKNAIVLSDHLTGQELAHTIGHELFHALARRFGFKESAFLAAYTASYGATATEALRATTKALGYDGRAGEELSARVAGRLFVSDPKFARQLLSAVPHEAPSFVNKLRIALLDIVNKLNNAYAWLASPITDDGKPKGWLYVDPAREAALEGAPMDQKFVRHLVAMANGEVLSELTSNSLTHYYGEYQKLVSENPADIVGVRQSLERQRAEEVLQQKAVIVPKPSKSLIQKFVHALKHFGRFANLTMSIPSHALVGEATLNLQHAQAAAHTKAINFIRSVTAPFRGDQAHYRLFTLALMMRNLSYDMDVLGNYLKQNDAIDFLTDEHGEPLTGDEMRSTFEKIQAEVEADVLKPENAVVAQQLAERDRMFHSEVTEELIHIGMLNANDRHRFYYHQQGVAAAMLKDVMRRKPGHDRLGNARGKPGITRQREHLGDLFNASYVDAEMAALTMAFSAKAQSEFDRTIESLSVHDDVRQTAIDRNQELTEAAITESDKGLIDGLAEVVRVHDQDELPGGENGPFGRYAPLFDEASLAMSNGQLKPGWKPSTQKNQELLAHFYGWINRGNGAINNLFRRGVLARRYINPNDWKAHGTVGLAALVAEKYPGYAMYDRGEKDFIEATLLNSSAANRVLAAGLKAGEHPLEKDLGAALVSPREIRQKMLEMDAPPLVLPGAIVDHLSTIKSPRNDVFRAWKKISGTVAGFLIRNPLVLAAYLGANAVANISQIATTNPRWLSHYALAQGLLAKFNSGIPLAENERKLIGEALDLGVIRTAMGYDVNAHGVDGVRDLMKLRGTNGPAWWELAKSIPGTYGELANTLIGVVDEAHKLSAWLHLKSLSRDKIAEQGMLLGTTSPTQLLSLYQQPSISDAALAARVARDAAGDYSATSPVAKSLAFSGVAPFIKWFEIKFKWVLARTRNVLYGTMKRSLRSAASGAMVAALASGYLVHEWNHTFFPDEAKELDAIHSQDAERIIIGRDANGNVRTIPFLDIWRDVLNTIGVGNPGQVGRDLMSGAVTPGEQMKESAESFGASLAGQINPLAQLGFGLTTGLQLDQNQHRLKAIDNVPVFAASKLGLRQVSRTLDDRPRNDWTWQDLFSQARDPDELKTYEAAEIVNRLKNRNEASSGERDIRWATGPMVAARNARAAIAIGDTQGAVEALREYFRPLEGDPRKVTSFESSLRALGPWGSTSADTQAKLEKLMTPEQKKLVDEAVKYHDEYWSPKNPYVRHVLRLAVQGDTDLTLQQAGSEARIAMSPLQRLREAARVGDNTKTAEAADELANTLPEVIRGKQMRALAAKLNRIEAYLKAHPEKTAEYGPKAAEIRDMIIKLSGINDEQHNMADPTAGDDSTWANGIQDEVDKHAAYVTGIYDDLNKDRRDISHIMSVMSRAEATGGVNPHRMELARAVLPRIQALGTTISFVDTGSELAHFMPADNHITIDMGGLAALAAKQMQKDPQKRSYEYHFGTVLVHAIAHEAVHATTSYYLKANPEFRAKVRALMDKAQAAPVFQNASGKREYGFTDEHEFLAETMSNMQFQTKLMGVQMNGQSLFRHFVSAVKSLLASLGITTISDDTALEQALRAYAEAADSQQSMFKSRVNPHTKKFRPSPMFGFTLRPPTP